MTPSKYDEALEQYLASISLSDTQAARIESALKRFSVLMLTTYGDPEIYAQGSYATDTLVKPLTKNQSGDKAGEFDVDIVVERTTWDSAKDSLESIEATIEADPVFSGMPIDKTKQSCVRVDYASDSSGVGFHVDIVPTLLDDENRQVAVRKSDKWKDSDAKQFADWFNTLCEKEPRLRQVAVILKRIRDLNGQGDNIKSILILTLTVEHYTHNDSLMNDLTALLDDIQDTMKEVTPTVDNPVNPGENLMDGVDDYVALRTFFSDAQITLDNALTDDDNKALEDFFGPGFKAPAKEKATTTAAAITPLLTPTKAYGVDGKD